MFKKNAETESVKARDNSIDIHIFKTKIKTCFSAGFLLYECQINHGKFGKRLGTSKQVFLAL